MNGTDRTDELETVSYKFLLARFQALSWVHLFWGSLLVQSITVPVTGGSEERIYELCHESDRFWRSPS